MARKKEFLAKFIDYLAANVDQSDRTIAVVSLD
jgi:hypothetical protein